MNCKKCNKTFQSNYLLQRHLKRKNPCISDDNLIIQYNLKIDEINNKILKLLTESIQSQKECKFCNKIFCKNFENIFLGKISTMKIIKNKYFLLF